MPLGEVVQVLRDQQFGADGVATDGFRLRYTYTDRPGLGSVFVSASQYDPSRERDLIIDRDPTITE